jgi:PKD repeat protein
MRKLSLFLSAVCLVGLICCSCASQSSSDSGSGDPPVANFTASPLSGDPALEVHFTNASTGTITSYSWDFGDGITSSTTNPVHTYDTDGVYTVTLTVVGPGGYDTETKIAYITCGNPPGPTVEFEGSPLSGDASLTVQFTDLSTGNNVHAWLWNFGDGGSSTQQNPEYIYNTAGTYNVTLSATDDDGIRSLTKDAYIEVTGGGTGTGIDPSGGSGGTITPGSTGTWSCSAGNIYIYIPTSYNPSVLASPVVWLLNEKRWQWDDIADANGIILVDLDEYNDVTAYNIKIPYAYPKLEAEYNVDKARYYFAGWSAGGNIAIGFTDTNQTFIAAAMVFPGSGGAAPAKPAGRPNGAKYYYAVGTLDTGTGYYPGCVTEANTRQSQGYTTQCDVVNGEGHSLPDSKRLDGWNWVKDFNLQN